MLYWKMTAAFQKIDKSYQIAVYIGKRILQTIPYSSLSRKVNYMIKSFCREQFRESLLVCQIQLDKSK